MSASLHRHIAILVLAAWLPPVCMAAQEAGRFQFVAGSVKVVSAQGVERPAAKGEGFSAGDTLVTGPDGTAQIRMSDGGLMAVRADTHLRLDQYVFSGREDGTERSLVSLFKGGFRAVTGLIGNRNKDRYAIRTPTATIGIRGTDHEPVVITPGTAGGFQPGTYERVYRGAAIIETDKGRLLISPNQVGFAGRRDLAPVLLPKIPEFYGARAGGKPSGEESRRDQGARTESSKGQEREKPQASGGLRKDLQGTDKAILRSPLDTPAASPGELGTPGVKADTLRTAPLTPLDTGAKPSSPAAGAGATPRPDALRTPITAPTAAPQGAATPIQRVPPAAAAPRVAPGQLDKPIQAPGQIKQLQTQPQTTKPTRQ
jgi:hypothetical protein